jgi:hypothetical protein
MVIMGKVRKSRFSLIFERLTAFFGEKKNEYLFSEMKGKRKKAKICVLRAENLLLSNLSTKRRKSLKSKIKAV